MLADEEEEEPRRRDDHFGGWVERGRVEVVHDGGDGLDGAVPIYRAQEGSFWVRGGEGWGGVLDSDFLGYGGRIYGHFEVSADEELAAHDCGWC